MPELPEVECARKLLAEASEGCTITKVETTPDDIVFVDLAKGEFEKTLTGRDVLSVERRGKLFWMNLSDKTRKQPLLHFGMTGMLHLRGEDPIWYVSHGSKAKQTSWPPKYMKFILHLTPKSGGGETRQIAFLDARRLARVRLLLDPLKEPPVSELGPDPIHNPPTLEAFSTAIIKRRAPIKSVLLDQATCAGVGNWVADEILFHARIHPSTLASSLDEAQVAEVRSKMLFVCETAVEVNANSHKFPDGWLFKHRWGKGKKGIADKKIPLPDGKTGSLDFITIGGRTSAFVPEVQIAPSSSGPSSNPKKKTATRSPAKGKGGRNKKVETSSSEEGDSEEESSALSSEEKAEEDEDEEKPAPSPGSARVTRKRPSSPELDVPFEVDEHKPRTRTRGSGNADVKPPPRKMSRKTR